MQKWRSNDHAKLGYVTHIFPKHIQYAEDYTGFASGRIDDGVLEDSFELMQFTGLLDKNGKEIYVGDVLREFRIKSAPMANNGIDRKFTVEDIRDLDFCPDQCTIIGNIYENSELLED